MLNAIKPMLRVNLEKGRLQKAIPNVKRKRYLWIKGDKSEPMINI
jgi:hypothetical protein